MAKICVLCNTANGDNSVFCNGCGASLSDAIYVADSKKGRRIKQEQNPVARRLLSIVLIFAMLLCLVATFTYISGDYSLKQVNTVNWEYILENTQNPEDILEWIFYSPENYTMHRNSWNLFEQIIKNVQEYGNIDRIGTDNILIILSQICNTVAYLILTILIAVATLLVLMKSKAARVVVWVAAVAGLIVLIVGSLIGYFFVVYDVSANSVYAIITTKYHLVPHHSVFAMIPLFIQMPVLALLLPAKKQPE